MKTYYYRLVTIISSNINEPKHTVITPSVVTIATMYVCQTDLF